MKNLVLILLIMYSFSQSLYSQIVWAPQSAKWTYSGQGQIISYIEIEYIKDTLLLGKQSKVLNKKQFTYRSQTNDVVSSFLGIEITYEEDSVVYLYRSGGYDTLYNFNSSIGDSWRLNCCQGDTSCIATITDTGTTIINDQHLKYIAVEYDYGDLYPFKVNDTIIERIGTTNMYILPCDIIAEQLDGNEGSKLRCYSDNELGNYSNNFEKDCDYLTSTNAFNYESFKLYPNPCTNTLYTENTSNSGMYLEIRNVSGTLFLSDDLIGKNQSIDISSLPKGVYFIIITTSKGKLFRKIIKS